MFRLTLFTVHYVLVLIYFSWVYRCNPISIENVYGFTIVSDMCSAVVSALIEMYSPRDVLLDISVIIVCLLSSVLRFVASTCENCSVIQYTMICDRNACYEDSARGSMNTLMIVLPLVVVVLRSRRLLELTY